MICPECQETVAESSAFCQQCGTRMGIARGSSVSALSGTMPPAPASGFPWWLIAMVVLLAVAASSWAWATMGGKASAGSGVSGSASISSPDFSVGNRFRLFDPNGGPILLFPSLQDKQALVNASVADDRLGIANMLLTGRLVNPHPGTSVLVIGFAPGFFNANFVYTRRVRILDGPLAGDAFWVQTSQLRP